MISSWLLVLLLLFRLMMDTLAIETTKEAGNSSETLLQKYAIIRQDPKSFHGLSDVLANLLQVVNTDAVFISDFSKQKQVMNVFLDPITC